MAKGLTILAVMYAALHYRWVILGLALLCQIAITLGGLSLSPLAPLFQPELKLSKAEVGLFVSATSVGGMSVMLLSGSLTDRYGIRGMISLGLVVRGAPLLLMPAMGSLLQVVAVMLAVGLGGGMAMPGPTKAIMVWFPPAFRATAMGLKQIGTPIAGIITASALPALGLAFGWRAALGAVGVAILGAAVATALLYRDPPRSTPVPRDGTSMKAGIKTVLRTRALWSAGSVGFLAVVVQVALITHMPLYFKEVVLVSAVPNEGARIVAAGGYLALAQVGGLFGRVFWGVLSDRLFRGQRLVVLGIIGAISGVACTAMGRLAVDSPSWLISGAVLAAGVSAIGWNGVYHAMITETVGTRYAATGVGLGMTMIEVGAMVGPPLFGYLVDASGSYQVAWLFLGGLSAGMTLLSLLNARVGWKHGRAAELWPPR